MSLFGTRPLSPDRDVRSRSRPLGPSAATSFQRRLGFRLRLNTQDLRGYQILGARLIAQAVAEARSYLVGDEMRLGKTCQVLRAIDCPAIVGCPASLRRVWRDEARRWAPHLRVILPPSRELPRPRHHELVVQSYDAMPEPLREDRLVRTDLSGVLYVPDEVHWCRNPEALRTQAHRALAAQCRSVLGLTGTPLVGTPLDFWEVLVSCRLAEAAFGSKAGFLQAFGAEPKDFGYDYEPDSAEIRRALAPHMLRRRRREVVPELPEKSYSEVRLPVPDDLLDSLRAADEMWKLLGVRELPPFEMLSAVRAAIARAKVDAAVEWAEERTRAGIPALVFGAHLEPLEAVARVPGWAALTGATPAGRRKALADDFQAGTLKGLAVAIQAGGVGLAMSRAEDVLFTSRSYVPGENDQAEDRAVLVEAGAPRVSVTDLLLDHPVEERLLEIVAEKRRLALAAVG